jgi:glycerol kinase
MQTILAIDAGTTSTRAAVFDLGGRIVASCSEELTQHYPRPGWVEHDAGEIWARTLACARAAAETAGGEGIAAIGITNQRETIVFWDRATGEPLAPAIVWQDRRTADACAALRAAGAEAPVQAKTGLLLDPYFSATKIRWALENWPAVKDAADEGRLAVGTVDSYLIFRLTEGRRHVTDATNASRTLLMDIRTCAWDTGLVSLFGVPADALPEIVDSAGPLGETALIADRRIPIAGCAGDQQAAAIGQGCLKPGAVKSTYGTGAFLLAHAGATPPASSNRLLSTVAWRIDGAPAYALEGSIFVAGSAVKWLRDALGIIGAASETAALAASVPDSGGAVFVPAFVGLGAPWWRPEARGLISGISSGTTRAHIVRACLEAMSNQTADLLDAIRRDGVNPGLLRVDGGMVANDWLCQDLADMLAVTVERPVVIETTALGAAMLAGVGCGMFGDLESAQAMWQADRRFEPSLGDAERRARQDAWARAIEQVVAGLEAR